MKQEETASRRDGSEIAYRVSPPVTDDELNELFSSAWPGRAASQFQTVLGRSLAYICAFDSGRLVGFVNLAWDGGEHAFLLDTTVRPAHRRRGVGRQLVRRAAELARERGVEWLHVDFEPHLGGFYRGCGFTHTEAGLMNLKAGRRV